LSAPFAVQQCPNLKEGGLVQILSGTPVRLMVVDGVSGSHGWAASCDSYISEVMKHRVSSIFFILVKFCTLY
jgi:hypothetical protein